MDTTELDLLVAVSRGGSFSAAAKRRGIAVSTVARRLAGLERALGLALVDRRAGGARLTEHGTRIAEAAEPIAEQLDRVRRAAAALRSESRLPPIRLSATEFVISDVLAPRLDRLWAGGGADPVRVELQVQADIVSLAARDADLAIRMRRPEGASLIIRKLPEIGLGLYAARSYLAGRDGAAIDLAAERLLTYDDSYGLTPELRWLRASGLAGAVAMRTASTRALLTAARAGAGIALLPEAIARQAGDLVALPAPPLPPRTAWLVVHRDLARDPAMRRVRDWAADCFAALMQRDAPLDAACQSA